jgi:hypothetical protein
MAGADEMEAGLRARLEACRRRLAPSSSTSSASPTSTASIGSASSGGNPKTRAFAELLIDCEEDRTLLTVLVMILREAGLSLGHWAHRGAASQASPTV